MIKKVVLLECNHDYTTYGVWGSGLLVKDFFTLTFINENGERERVITCVNYSARGYGRMVRENAHYKLNGRMFDKHFNYLCDAKNFSEHKVKIILSVLVGREFKSVNNFLKDYNGLLNKMGWYK